MIAGSQGSGKSSLSKLISFIYLEILLQKCPVIISIDDFYYLRIKEHNFQKKYILYLLTRGVPGTHDLELINKKIKQIFNKEFPIYFLFLTKSRYKKKTYKKVLKADVIIFEGWCVGAQPVDQKLPLYKILIILKSLKIKILFGEIHIIII